MEWDNSIAVELQTGERELPEYDEEIDYAGGEEPFDEGN